MFDFFFLSSILTTNLDKLNLLKKDKSKPPNINNNIITLITKITNLKNRILDWSVTYLQYQ